MNRFIRIGLPVAVLSLVGLLAARAVAADKDVVAKMDASKVTLTKAIEAAEAGSKGKATAATAKMDGDKLAFVVHTVVGDKVMEVPVDATGKAGAAPLLSSCLASGGAGLPGGFCTGGSGDSGAFNLLSSLPPGGNGCGVSSRTDPGAGSQR